jgi:hypothetical protein
VVVERAASGRARGPPPDSSLLQEWESLLRAPAAAPAPAPPRLDLALTPKAFRARVRAEMHALVAALAEGDFAEAARWVRSDPEDPWTPERLEAALAPFLERHERVRFEPQARRSHNAVLNSVQPRVWRVQQVLPDPEGEDFWCIEGEVDLRVELDPDAPLVRLIAIHD